MTEYTEGHKQYTESTIDPETENTHTADESTANTDTSERHGVKTFNPKTELPKADWRRKLDYKVPAVLKHV